MNATKPLTHKILWTLALLLVAGVAIGQAQPDIERREPPVFEIRFAAFDVFVDSGDQPLAAWQIDLHADDEKNTGTVRIAGIEGGEHEQYRTPPVYDPRAMQHDRVIIGAFSTADDANLPKGRTRVARIHVRLQGPEGFVPEFDVVLETAATPLGVEIAGEVSLEKGEQP